MEYKLNPLQVQLYRLYIQGLNILNLQWNLNPHVEFYIKHAAELSEEVGFVPLSSKEYLAVKQHVQTLKTGTAFKDGPAIGLSVKEILARSATK